MYIQVLCLFINRNKTFFKKLLNTSRIHISTRCIMSCNYLMIRKLFSKE